MSQKFANAARAELAATINDTDTTISVVDLGSLFPVANTGTTAISESLDWFKLTIQDKDNYEIVFVRTHASGSNEFSNVLRGQEGTVARSFLAGSIVGLRPTAGDAASVNAAIQTKQNKNQDSLSITYNGNGSVNTVTEDGVTKTFTYNGDGTINTVSWPVGTKTRTETFSYSSGSLTGKTSVEV